jgi:hypothetical protein
MVGKVSVITTLIPRGNQGENSRHNPVVGGISNRVSTFCRWNLETPRLPSGVSQPTTQTHVGCRFYVDFHRAFEYKGTALPISSVGVLQ